MDKTDHDSTIQDDIEKLQRALFGLSWASQRRLAHKLEGYHLTLPQYSALRAIHHHPARNCKMTELAESVLQVSATMTGIIDRLVERGLVDRTQDPSDRRVLRVSLTNAGNNLLAEIDRAQRSHLKLLFSGLTPDERRKILNLLEHYLSITMADSE